MFLVTIVLGHVHQAWQTYIFARVELLGLERITVRGLQPASWEICRPLWSSVTISKVCLIGFVCLCNWNWRMGASFYVLSCDCFLADFLACQAESNVARILGMASMMRLPSLSTIRDAASAYTGFAIHWFFLREGRNCLFCAHGDSVGQMTPSWWRCDGLLSAPRNAPSIDDNILAHICVHARLRRPGFCDNG